jgi:hypothetical protein
VTAGWTPAQRLSWARTLVADEPLSGNGLQGTAAELEQLCRAMIRVIPLSGAAVSLMNDGGPIGIVASSDDVWAEIEELPFILGEGPCWDAFESRRPVFCADVGSADELRWPGYSAAAVENGVRAAFALPLQVGYGRLGVLDLYRDRPGGLEGDDRTLALAFAEVATSLLVEGQQAAHSDAIPSGVYEALGSRFEAYQAQGMVMVQLGVPLGEAMARLRAYAYANDRTLGEVAREIVSRSLTFEREGSGPGPEKGSGP